MMLPDRDDNYNDCNGNGSDDGFVGYYYYYYDNNDRYDDNGDCGGYDYNDGGGSGYNFKKTMNIRIVMTVALTMMIAVE